MSAQEQELFDITKNCIRCGDEFIFTVNDQLFYKEKGYVDPRNCRPCRMKIKAEKEAREQK